MLTDDELRAVLAEALHYPAEHLDQVLFDDLPAALAAMREVERVTVERIVTGLRKGGEHDARGWFAWDSEMRGYASSFADRIEAAAIRSTGEPNTRPHPVARWDALRPETGEGR